MATISKPFATYSFSREEFDILILALDILNGSYGDADRDDFLKRHDHHPAVDRLITNLNCSIDLQAHQTAGAMEG